MSATPLQLARGERTLLALLDAPRAPLRAGVLVCAPLLHEHVRGYRLFALLADALAQCGTCVLRFDYHGTGDSSGEDDELTLAGALDDARHVLGTLAAHARGVPLVVLGVRAGAFVAASLACSDPRVAATWLWQPIASGDEYVSALQARDRAERVSRLRFPLQPAAPEESVLMGFRVCAQLVAELRAARLPPAAQLPCALALDTRSTRALPGATALQLPPSLSDWAGELDIGGMFPPSEVCEIARQLAATLPQRIAA